jgi:Fe2+ or Zn2+ uptake regulation protein
MDAAAMEKVLKEQGCSLTPQRRAVLRFLDHNLDHPSAPEIFEAVTRDFPITSRATVYNTLALLEQVGAVRTVRGTDGDTRYDPNVTPHHHRCCDRCGRLEDVPAGAVTVLLNGRAAAGEVRFTGLCARCEASATA